jgi:hypothetical protein
MLGRDHPVAASGATRANATMVGRRACSVTTSVTTTATPAIGQEIAASQRRKEQANLTQAEEDEEPTLLMAMVEEIKDASAPPLTVK